MKLYRKKRLILSCQVYKIKIFLKTLLKLNLYLPFLLYLIYNRIKYHRCPQLLRFFQIFKLIKKICTVYYFKNKHHILNKTLQKK